LPVDASSENYVQAPAERDSAIRDRGLQRAYVMYTTMKAAALVIERMST
jgi:hypothetical protein